MIYEATTTHIVIDDKGNDKNKKERFIIDGMETFSEVESMLFEEYGTLREFDVPAIKRSNIKEIANKRQSDEDKIYIAEIEDIFTTDTGEEKPIKYKIVFFSSSNFDDALYFITEFLKQGFDMSLISLKQSNFIDVL